MDLILVAHPDDEVLWFSSYLNEGKTVIATCADNRRHIKTPYDSLNLGLVDDYNSRLDPEDILDKIVMTVGNEALAKIDRIITHSYFGDTDQHWHHQDVAVAAAHLACRLKLAVVHCQADKAVTRNVVKYLSDGEFKTKIDGLNNYFSEMQNIYFHYPVFRDESLVEVPTTEIFVYYAQINEENTLIDVEDFWGFGTNKWELERYALMCQAAKNILAGVQSQNNLIRICDYGAHDGRFLDCLKLDYEVTKVGYDIESKYSNILRKKGYADKNINDPTYGQEFELVTMFSVLEYMTQEEYTKVIARAKTSDLLLGINSVEVLQHVMDTYDIESVTKHKGRLEANGSYYLPMADFYLAHIKK
jgi:hypothetical protein